MSLTGPPSDLLSEIRVSCITFATGDRSPSLGVLRLRGTDVVRALAYITHHDGPGSRWGTPSTPAASRFASLPRRTGAVASSNRRPLVRTALVAGEWDSAASERHINPRHPVLPCVRRRCVKDVRKGFQLAGHSQHPAKAIASFEVHKAYSLSFRGPSAPRVAVLMA